MGREVRRVPANWQHPKDGNDRFIPLRDGSKLTRRTREWDEEAAKWAAGLCDDYSGGWKPLDEEQRAMTYAEWAGERPDPAEYMPVWPDTECTHLMMYEDTTEGTPISPAFDSPEKLARWLADNGASAFGRGTASYDEWMAMIGQGWVVSAVSDPQHGFRSGVAASIDLHRP